MKLIILIAFLCSSLSFATDCEVRKGFTVEHTICWDKKIKGHVSKDCLTGKCDALKIKRVKSLTSEPGSNRTVSACTNSGAEVIVLKDPQGNEDSFCQYSDGSLRSAASVESAL